MNKNSDKKLNRSRRHRKVRAKISGTSSRPRIAVFKSNQYIYAQVVDDESGKTLLSVSDMEVKKGKKSEKALKIGETLAARMKEKGLLEAVFDRGGFKFHGRVKSVADGLRNGGIKF
ncbi:MAG: 50S ribosomal protein L18 [Candidatus Yanofskybacteria bacterium]|nr:50S ribosomal protein L18 [Candidatus Yanofskybacteria bacterium]